MANGMPSWEEWNEQLTQEQRSYSLYKILQSMDAKLTHCPVQKQECDGRFKTLENRKKLDTGLSAFFGFVGGAVAMIGKKLLGG